MKHSDRKMVRDFFTSLYETRLMPTQEEFADWLRQQSDARGFDHDQLARVLLDSPKAREAPGGMIKRWQAEQEGDIKMPDAPAQTLADLEGVAGEAPLSTYDDPHGEESMWAQADVAGRKQAIGDFRYRALEALSQSDPSILQDFNKAWGKLASMGTAYAMGQGQAPHHAQGMKIGEFIEGDDAGYAAFSDALEAGPEQPLTMAHSLGRLFIDKSMDSKRTIKKYWDTLRLEKGIK
jgi:hypothetical protein